MSELHSADSVPPEAQCLGDDPHPPHEWRSVTHQWSCPGRSVTRQERLAGAHDVRISGAKVDLATPHFGTAVYAEISAERQRAHAKHGRNSMEGTSAGSFLRYTILAEEVGEIAKEFNEAQIRGGQYTLDLKALRNECIQVAAMAAAWADRLGFEIAQTTVTSPGVAS